MSPTLRREIRQEAEVIERFARVYRQRFSELIQQVNSASGQVPSRQCLGTCLETIDMMLESQRRLTGVLRKWTSARAIADEPIRSAA